MSTLMKERQTLLDILNKSTVDELVQIHCLVSNRLAEKAQYTQKEQLDEIKARTPELQAVIDTAMKYYEIPQLKYSICAHDLILMRLASRLAAEKLCEALYEAIQKKTEDRQIDSEIAFHQNYAYDQVCLMLRKYGLDTRLVEWIDRLEKRKEE